MAARAYSDKPIRVWHAVTKDDDADLPGGPYRCLLVDEAGTISFHDDEGNVVEGFPLQRGYNPIVVRRILDAGTATNIWAGR